MEANAQRMLRVRAIMATDTMRGNTSASFSARLFISYSRKNRSFVEQLVASLEGGGYDVWVDLQDIRPSEEWLAAIHSAIESADVVVFVLSTYSLDPSSVCARELEHAIRHNKRLVPVVCSPVDTRTTQVPDAIGKLNWVSFLEPECFDRGVVDLISAIGTDLDWVKQHTRYLGRAVEWDAARRDDSYALQKNDLLAAETWLALGATDKEPRPTALQTTYILESRAAATRRRRTQLLLGAIAAVLVAVGATVAIYQYRQAEERRTVARARDLAAEALFERDRHLERAIPLAHEAFTTRALPETAHSAMAVGQTAAEVLAFLRGHRGPVAGICFIGDGRHLLTVAADGQTILWSLETRGPVAIVRSEAAGEQVAIACNPSAPDFAVATLSGRLELYSLDGDRPTRLHDIQDSDGITRLKFSTNGRFLATGNLGGLIKLRTFPSGEIAVMPLQHRESITALALTETADFVAVGTSGSNDRGGEVFLWARGETAPRFSKDPFALGVSSVSVAKGGVRVTAIGVEASFAAWGADGTETELEISTELQIGDIPVSAFDDRGERAMVANGRTSVVVNSNTGATSYVAAQRMAGHSTVLTALAFDPISPRAATGSEDGLVIVHRLHEPGAGGGAWVVPDFDGTSTDITFSAAGHALVVDPAGSPRAVALPDVVPISSPPSPSSSPASVQVVQPARHYAVTITQDQVIILEQKDGTRELGRITPDPGQNAMAGTTTPDGRWWVAASENAVRIREAGREGFRPVALPAGFGVITSVAISNDGSLVAIAGGDALNSLARRFGMSSRKILIAETATGKTIGSPLEGLGANPVEQLEFDPEGDHLLVRTAADAVVWPIGPRSWLRRACAVLEVALSAEEWEQRLPGSKYPDRCE
jgi:WD40 repeat protein